MKYENIPLIFNEDDQRFEFSSEGQLSFIDFKKINDKIYLIHTEVPQELEGKGIAAAMVEKTLKHIEEHQWKLIPSCSYVQAFVKRHPEWNRLL